MSSGTRTQGHHHSPFPRRKPAQMTDFRRRARRGGMPWPTRRTLRRRGDGMTGAAELPIGGRAVGRGRDAFHDVPRHALVPSTRRGDPAFDGPMEAALGPANPLRAETASAMIDDSVPRAFGGPDEMAANLSPRSAVIAAICAADPLPSGRASRAPRPRRRDRNGLVDGGPVLSEACAASGRPGTAQRPARGGARAARSGPDPRRRTARSGAAASRRPALRVAEAPASPVAVLPSEIPQSASDAFLTERQSIRGTVLTAP